jgi:hypothetical protein
MILKKHSSKVENMKLTIATLLMLFSANLVAQDSQKPQISAFFDRVDNGPAFFVGCRNTSDKPVSSGAGVWASSLRLDGTTVPDEPHMGPGLTTEVKPGQLWRGIVALRQSYSPFFPAVKFGALVRIARVVPLSQGQHTIAVQCAGIWSEDFEFYWESD